MYVCLLFSIKLIYVKFCDKMYNLIDIHKVSLVVSFYDLYHNVKDEKKVYLLFGITLRAKSKRKKHKKINKF